MWKTTFLYVLTFLLYSTIGENYFTSPTLERSEEDFISSKGELKSSNNALVLQNEETSETVKRHHDDSPQQQRLGSPRSLQGTQSINWYVTSYPARTYPTGTSVQFVWSAGHNVLQFASEAKMNGCDFSNSGTVPNRIYVNDGTAETVYFGCSFGSHCNYGQKIAITFVAPADPSYLPSAVSTASMSPSLPLPPVAAPSTTSSPSAVTSTAPSSTSSDITSNNIISITWKTQSYEPITLCLGDSITFVNSGTHDLVKMASEAAMEDCDFGASGNEWLFPQTYENDGVTEEVVYFSCSVGLHCAAGQKIEVIFKSDDCVDTNLPVSEDVPIVLDLLYQTLAILMFLCS